MKPYIKLILLLSGVVLFLEVAHLWSFEEDLLPSMNPFMHGVLVDFDESKFALPKQQDTGTDLKIPARLEKAYEQKIPQQPRRPKNSIDFTIEPLSSESEKLTSEFVNFMKKKDIREEFPVALQHFGWMNAAVEIGVFQGDYSEVIHSKWKGDLFLIEPFPQSRLERRAEEWKDENVTLKTGFSFEFLEDFPDEYFDFVYIDSNHSYQFVMEDMILYYPKLKKGRLFAGHDYCVSAKQQETIPGMKEKPWCGPDKKGYASVVRAVDDFAAKINRKVHFTSERTGSQTSKYRKRNCSWYFLK